MRYGITLAVVLALAGGAWAQLPANLEQALAKAYWSADERGPLVVVDPVHVGLAGPPGAPTPVLPEPPRQGYNVAQLAPYFQRTLVRFGRVSVLAPTTMKVLQFPKLKPEEGLLLERSEAASELVRSLTPAQWKLLGSQQGLGLSDLSQKQRPYFQALFSEGIRVQPTAGEATPLSPTQRAGIRLRAAQKSDIFFFAQAAEGVHMVGFGDLMERQGAPPPFYVTESGQGDSYIQHFLPELPNRLKPGDLSFASERLDNTVTLEPELTLAELVRRAGAVTRLELYADPRVGRLPVKLRGTAARAGDLLQALCFAVCGTFRKVGPAYVLTCDREGIGTRFAAMNEWRSDLANLSSRRREEWLKSAGQEIDLPNGDSAPLSSSVQQTVRRLRGRYDQDSPGIGVDLLPTSLQEAIRTKAATQKLTIGGANGQVQEVPVRGDRVMIQPNVRMTLIVPGLGEGTYYGSDLPWRLNEAINYRNVPEAPSTPAPAPAALNLPSGWKERVLWATAARDTDIAPLCEQARAAGVTQLWLTVPLQKTSRALLEAAVAAGKAKGIAVGASVSLLQPPTSALTTGLIPDISILGETTSQYLQRRSAVLNERRFEISPLRQGFTFVAPQPVAKTVLVGLLSELAQTPGLAGLVVQESEPPGYSSRGMYYLPSVGLGYSLENRLAFLRQYQADPIDLVGSEFGVDYRLRVPFFEAEMNGIKMAPSFATTFAIPIAASAGAKPLTLEKDWAEFRRQQALMLRRDIYADLRQAGVILPLYLELMPGSLWLGRWESPEMALSGNIYENINTYPQAKKLSSFLLVRMGAWDKANPDDLRRSWQGIVDTQKLQPWNGIVIDATGVGGSGLDAIFAALRR